MADAPIDVGDPGWILHGRPRLNLAMRWTTRAHELVSRGGAARGALRAAAGVGSAVADAALVRHLRGSRRSETAVHLAVDAADLALWTALSTTDGYSQLATAMNTSHPMAIEAGARYGLAGVGVPVLNALVAGAVARARGRTVRFAPWVWQVAAALGGVGLARYARRRRERQLRRHASTLEPELARAELEGLNEAALGLGNVFDEIQRAVSLVTLASPTGPGDGRPRDDGGGVSGAGTWKAAVAERTRERYVYLVDVLVRWQQHHNQRADLSGVVALSIDPGLAPVVLDAPSAAALWDALGRTDPTGRIAVAAATDDASATGDGDDAAHDPGSVELAVGEHRITVAVTAPEVELSFDPLPGAFAWMALWLAAAGPRDGVRPLAALAPAGAALGLMWWSHRRGTTDRRDRDVAVVASSALALVAGVVQTRWVGSAHIPNPDVPGGIPRVPASLGLRGHAFVTEMCRAGARPSTIAGAWAVVPATLALCRSMTPAPRPWREFLAESTWVAMSASMAHAFTEGIERDSDELEAQVSRHDRERREERRRRGREVATDAARRMLADAERLHAERSGSLPADVDAEVRRRLTAAATALGA